ncbi:hypothetical protein MTR_2g048415 [Medicago truncatula]|uniref:Uncharacterized protein n=1 Tax=Medicago truncatula TaxID=3880 RepID=A0A072V6X9_MEDTR|nr:hypothetical protein MTR_2g048415 [Medicago truncatula]
MRRVVAGGGSGAVAGGGTTAPEVVIFIELNFGCLERNMTFCCLEKKLTVVNELFVSWWRCGQNF